MADAEVIRLVELAEYWIAQKTGNVLNDAQKTILSQALAGKKLKTIQVMGYSQNTVQRDLAPKLWKQLSAVTGKRVTIKTLRLILEGLPDADTENSDTLTPPPPLSVSTTTFPSPIWELPGGQLDLASPCYVERPADESRAYEEISKPGSLIRIKAPRQMGKTSLMVRLLYHAERQGCQSVALNFELAEREVFADLNQFLQWFCATVTDDLHLPIQLENRWSKFLGSKKNCTNYFEKYLLPTLRSPLALGLDAVDRIFNYEHVADDFFGLLRAWHEKAKQHEIWKNFRLIIVHGTEVYIPLSNDQSPFNVGLPIELSEFDAHQVQDLALRYGLDFTWNDVKQLMAMVGGHPHLIRLALYKIARQDITLNQLLEDAPTETGIYADHLRLHRWNLEKHPDLADALTQILEADRPVQLKGAIAFKLNSMGLVYLVGNQVSIRNDLYRQYFCDRLNPEKPQSQDTKEHRGRIIPHSLGDNVLAAIVFTDIKDSTQKQHENQQPTLAAIHRDLKLMTKLCHQFEGEVLKSMGDGLLMYFVSAVKAVDCSQTIQKTLSLAARGLPNEEVLQHRIGIHLADVFFNGTDVQGDGVNIAARLQSQAKPGGICISWIVYEAVKNHLQLHVTDSEHRLLRGIDEPMLLYQISVEG